MIDTLLTRSVPQSAGRRGGALLLALIVVTVISLLASASFQLSASTAKRQAGAAHTRAAFYLAEAGLAEAYNGLVQGRSGAIGSEEEPAAFGNGLFWVEATERADGLIDLQSFARVRGARATLSAVAEPGRRSVDTLGLFSARPLRIPVGSVVDVYDSRMGAYVPTAGEDLGLRARIGSNGGVEIAGSAARPTTVVGDVIAGPAQTVSLVGDVTVLGNTGNAHATVPLPPPPASELGAGGTATALLGIPLLLLPGNATPSSLVVPPALGAVLVGPGQFVFENLSVGTLATLTLDTSAGPIDLVIRNSLTLAAGSAVECTASDPQALRLSIEGVPPGAIQLRAAGEFHGRIYGPEAHLIVGAQFQVFGSLVADQLTFDGAAQVHFDAAILDQARADWTPELVSWRILEIGEGEGGSSLAIVDPFEAMGLDRSTLPLPAVAHLPQTLDLKYVDLLGNFASYSGPEAGFDWSDLGRLIWAERDGERFVRAVDPIIPNVTPDFIEGLVPLDVATQLAVDLIEQEPWLDSTALRDQLLAASPLTDGALQRLLKRQRLQWSWDLRDVLLANPQAPPGIWKLLIESPERMTEPDLLEVLLPVSPLNASCVHALNDRVFDDPAIQAAILAAQ